MKKTLRVSIHEAKTHLSRLIQAVLDGDEVIIARGKTPVVRLEAYETKPRVPRLGTARGLFVVPDDFDAPVADFKDYS